nr:uncharacterized protein LOC129384468 isoform X3 [Dermacentor andersoni]
MNFEQVTPKISLAALSALNEFNNKYGIHIIYNAERTVHDKQEKTSIKPFPGYNIHHLVRFTKPDKRYSVRAGSDKMVEVGFRDFINNSFYIHHCLKNCWADNENKLFNPRGAPAQQEAMWIGLSFESGNAIKGSWGDCDAYHLYCGSVVTIKCRYTYNTSSYKGLSFAIGNVSGARTVVNFPAYTNTGESYVLQIFVGETVYNIVSKNESKVINNPTFKNTITRTYLDFASHNIVLDNVFMETSGSPWN